MFKIDMHTHTRYSFDSETDPIQLIQNAINNDIKVLAITDHYDTDNDDFQFGSFFQIEERKEEMLSLKKKFSDKIKILHAIELGQPFLRRELSDNIIKQGDFDYVLGSVHNLKGMPDFYYFDYSKMNNEMINKFLYNTFTSEIELTKIPYVNTIAHITYPLKYLYRTGKEVDLSNFNDILIELFKSMIKNNKILEVNTASMRKGTNFLMPEVNLIKLYKECGGELVTVGSDAHFAEHVGCEIEYVYNILKDLGFKYISFCENKELKQILI